MDATRRSFLAGAATLGALAPAMAAAQTGPLIQRAIPSSGEMLPVIGVGTARRYESAATEAELAPLRETLARFKALGGRVVDTAPAYGQAEAIVGRLVEELRIRPGLFLATKVGARSKADGAAQIEQSFKNLRTDRIDLIAVHNLLDVDAQLATLRDLKAARRIRYLGVTTSSDQQYPALETVMRREPLDFIQVDYALDNRGSAERILPLARERRMGVMINLPFGRDRLFNATRGKPLPDWAAEIGCTTWAQVFLKYVVSHPAVTCAVPGMAQARYVEDNMMAARGRLPDAALRRRMEQFIDGL
jgi:aryl-alcohol dehydrogenase-like predicted oxidoreductase